MKNVLSILELDYGLRFMHLTFILYKANCLMFVSIFFIVTK